MAFIESINLAGAAVYIAVNIVVFLMYIIDKIKAVNHNWRIPESTLLIGSFFGPFGAAAGMKLAHHKTQKPKFLLVYVFLVLHIVFFGLIFAGKI